MHVADIARIYDEYYDADRQQYKQNVYANPQCCHQHCDIVTVPLPSALLDLSVVMRNLLSSEKSRDGLSRNFPQFNRLFTTVQDGSYGWGKVLPSASRSGPREG